MKDFTKILETCKRILELEEFNLEMKTFCSDRLRLKEEHTCGTSYCISGRLAHLDGYPREYIDEKVKFNYGSYSLDLVQYDTTIWRFLFSPSWNNSLEHAKKRAQYIIDHKSAPEDWDGFGWCDYKWGME